MFGFFIYILYFSYLSIYHLPLGWFKTGDLATYDERGEISIICRKVEIIEYKDYRVYPVEIENVLCGHPDVLNAVVVPVPHEIDHQRALAFVSKIPDSKVYLFI